jgi:glutathione S-transferase
LIVAEYLDEAYPGEGKLRLEDPFAHAQERLAIEAFSKVLAPTYKLQKDEDFEANQATFNELLGKFLDRYLNHDFLGGQRPSYADYMIWPWIERFEYLKQFRSVQIDPKIAGKLQAYVDKMMELPAVKKTYQSPVVHKKFYDGYLSGKPNYDVHLE